MSETAPPKKAHRWLWGCGLGCGAILVIGTLAIGVLFYYVRHGMEHLKVLALEQMRATYEQYESEGKLTPEQREVFEPLLKTGAQDDTPMFATLLVLALFEENVRADGPHSAETLAVAREFGSFLQSHPQAGVGDIFSFVSKYPWLNEVFTKVSKEGAPFLLRPNQ